MRVIVWGINYHPEPTGIAPYSTDLCDFLAERGHDVEMVTGFRYYPYWERLPSDKGTLFRTDQVAKVKVHRCWCFLPKRPNALKRILHELSFCLLSFVRVLGLRRGAVVIVISPPLALGFFAWLACCVKRSPFIFHVQDLQPDAAVGLGMLKPGLLIRSLYRLEAFAYRKACLVSSISEGILKAFSKKGVPERKCLLFPNWLRSEPRDASVYGDGARVRKKFNISPDAFLALYSGNIGKKQNIHILCDAARLLAESPEPKGDIVIVIAGDGAGRTALENELSERPCSRLKLLPLLDEADYADMLSAAEVCLITQAPGTGQYFFPSKLLSALSARVPVLAVADADSELALAVQNGGFGAVIPADRAEMLSSAILSLSNNPSILKSWKMKTQWVDQFSREKVLHSFENRLIQFASKS